MTAEKLGVEADSDSFMESETMSTATESSSCENKVQGGKNKERREAWKKMKKVRSIKLVRMPSTRKGRCSWIQTGAKLSGYAASSEQSSTPIEMSDASPNDINAIRFFDAKEENFQGMGLTRESSFKLVRNMKFRRSRSSDLKMKLRKSCKTQDEDERSDMNKYELQLQASPCYSESNFDREILINETQNLAYLNKSVRVGRTSTLGLGPMRILTRIGSLKSKRSSTSTKKCCKVSCSISESDSSIERATCSSTLKHSKFPHHVHVGSESDGIAVSNICRYTYCSLHGHHHANKPSFKSFVSMKRRVAKTQKSLKPDHRPSSGKPKYSAGTRKKGVFNGAVETSSEIRKVSSVNLTETSSYSDPSHEETLQGLKDTSLDCNVIGAQEHEAIILGVPGSGTKIKLEEIVRINPQSGDSIHAKLEDACSEEFQDPTKSEDLSWKPEKIEDSELSHGIIQPATSTTDMPSKTEMENHKNFTFWKLIYQHMVTGLEFDADHETQNAFPGMKPSEEEKENLSHNSSCPENLETNQAMSMENHEAEARNQKLEISQSDAIMLVKQAFDKILSEIPDHSSDNQSIASEKTSDQDFLLQKQDDDDIEGKQVSTSTTFNSIEDCKIQEGEEMVLQTDNNIASESEEAKAAAAAQLEQKKSDKQMPSSWSHLKKIIILKRFVKSLEKVKNLKPRTKPNLPMDKEQEAEKIQLRHQNMEGRKNAEEWMLDHALRQVISTLAPSQKRKVALFVQAFETVIPLPRKGDDMRSNTAASSPTTSFHSSNELSVYNDDNLLNHLKKENGSEISVGKTVMCWKDGQDQYQVRVSESDTAYQQNPKAAHGPPKWLAASEMKKEDTAAVDDNDGNEDLIVQNVQPKLVHLSLPQLKELRQSDTSLTSEGTVGTWHENSFAANEQVIEKIPKVQTPILNSVVCNEGSEFSIKKINLESSGLVNSAAQQPDRPEFRTQGVRVGGGQPNYSVLCSPQEQTESNFSADISKAERQKYTRLWYLIYKHMVSGGVADEELHSDYASKSSRDNSGDCQGCFAASQCNMQQDHTTGSQLIECPDSEIIKLVEEAIDEIPLPEIQDDTSDNQSVTSGDAVPEQDFPGKKNGEVDQKFILSCIDSAKENSEKAKSIRAGQLHSTLNPESTHKDEKRRLGEETKSKERVQKNWSNLKKLVVLRRFVKALEKVRQFNPRGPRYLPMDSAPESERVSLRHLNMEDRKNAEEWMLDYGLQQVVSKLTPERKRRVQLLVEAFETVIPTIS